MSLSSERTEGRISLTNLGGSLPADKDTTRSTASPRKRFVLSGHSAPLDPAIHAVRPDLADVALASQVFAPHYAKALPGRVSSDAAIYSKPDKLSFELARVEKGEVIDLFDFNGGWAWVRASTAIGYISADAIEAA